MRTVDKGQYKATTNLQGALGYRVQQGKAHWLKQLTPVLSGELQDTQMINSWEGKAIHNHQRP